MKLTLEKILELLPNFRVDARGKNLTGPCPMCNHDEFGISLEEGHRFGCYRKKNCGFSGNIFTLLRFLGKYDEVVQERVRNLPDKINKYQFEANKSIDLVVETISPPLGWKRSYENEYLQQRGFDINDFNRYSVGITNIHPKLKKDYVVFLVEQEGECKGWVARRTESKEEIERRNRIRKQNRKPLLKRYLNSTSDFAKMLYGIDEVTDKTTTLIIVEGIFDKINIDKLLNLAHQDEIKCVCTFKASISEEQIELIGRKAPHLQNSILLYDSDVIKAIKINMNILQKRYNVLVGYHATKDCGDMNEEDLDQVLSKLETPIEFKAFKLEVNKL